MGARGFFVRGIMKATHARIQAVRPVTLKTGQVLAPGYVSVVAIQKAYEDSLAGVAVILEHLKLERGSFVTVKESAHMAKSVELIRPMFINQTGRVEPAGKELELPDAFANALLRARYARQPGSAVPAPSKDSGVSAEDLGLLKDGTKAELLARLEELDPETELDKGDRKADIKAALKEALGA
jgi:hypothetical protein